MKRLGYPYNRTVQSQASDAVTPVVRADVDVASTPTWPTFDDPLMQWHAALAVRDLAVTRVVWNDAGRGPKLVQFKYRKRPCSLNGLFELGVPRVGVAPGTTGFCPSLGIGAPNGAVNPAVTAVQDVAQVDRLGTVKATIDGVRVPEVHWHTRDARGTEGAVMVDDQEWQVVQFNGGGSRATAHLGVEPERVLARLCAAVEAFEAGTVNTEVSARARGTSRTFRRRF